jgi:hypothetical protein
VMPLSQGRYELSICKDGFAAPQVTVDVGEDLEVEVQASTAPIRAELEAALEADLVQYYV